MKLIPGSERRYQQKIRETEKSYSEAIDRYNSRVTVREEQINNLKKEYDRKAANYGTLMLHDQKVS